LALELFAYSMPCSEQQQVQGLTQQSPNES
jgi:hypothetical protein